MKKVFLLFVLVMYFGAFAVKATASETLPDVTIGAESHSIPEEVTSLKKTRGLTDMSKVFVPKGQWVTGINASFSSHTNNKYTFIVIDGIDSEGYTAKVSPILGYAFGDNSVFGVRFGYSRTYQKVDGGGIHMGDEETGVDIKVDFFYSLKHSYDGILFWRQYIPFGDNKRFALFTEMQLGLGGSQAKFAADMPVRGTYETGFSVGLNLNPGIVAFISNDMAVEVNIGVLGLTYDYVKQVHNKITVGERSLGTMNFKINILSIGLGMAFYL